MNDITKLPYRAAPSLVPEELSEMEFPCPVCKTAVRVPWLDKLSLPKRPIKSDVADGHLVPARFPIRCPVDTCQNEFNISIPRLPNSSYWTLYGDEAGRYISKPSEKHSNQALYFYCITLVGLHHRKQKRVQRQIEKLKMMIAPNRDPNTWQHHFTEIWGSKSDSGKFTLKNKDEKIEYAKKFAKIIRDARPDLVTFNVSGCILVPENKKEWQKQIKAQKEELFCQSILYSLRHLRASELGVRWVFDNIKDTTKGSRTEGWASECFLGLQYTRLFAWLSAGTTILEPDFVTPGSHYLLEIADFISYCVARDFEKVEQGSSSEFPSSLLGTGYFQGILGDGTVLYKPHRGLPLSDFYGLNS